jgi:type IV secretory pathway component VirB8
MVPWLMKDDIKAMVKDGSYFKDALAWYSSKYIFPFTQRASMLLLAGILVVGVLISVDAAKANFGSTKIPFPIFAKDQVNFFSEIKPLAYKKEPIEISIARYFIEKYVVLREEYNYLDFSSENKDITMDKIRALSSQQVYRGYYDYINPDENADSPIIKYKNQTARLIKIDNITIDAPNGYPESATINFTATERNKLESSAIEYEAKISFLMSNMTKVFEKAEPLYFIVNKYRTYELSK